MIRAALIGFGCLVALAWPGQSYADENSDNVQRYLSGRSDLILCVTYGITPTDSLRAELVNRKLLSEKDWKLLSKKSIDTGMSECGLLAGEGVPPLIAHDYDHFLEKVYPGFADRVGPYDVVYGLARGRNEWVVLKNGIVTNIVGTIE